MERFSGACDLFYGAKPVVDFSCDRLDDDVLDAGGGVAGEAGAQGFGVRAVP